MFRKTILALTGVAALGAAALAPTSASAWGYKGWGWGHHHHFHGGYGFYGARYVDFAPSCYYVKRINRFGNVRLVRVCS